MVEMLVMTCKALTLWSVFLLNVLSFKGFEKFNTFHHKAVAKQQKCLFYLVSLCVL